jgi:hypothetical protein
METMKHDNRIDFGNDDVVVPTNDPKFDAWIAKVAPTLNIPGAAPRGDMWQAIQAAQRTAREAQAGRVSGVTPLRRHWRLLSVIAAALLLGVAMDRFALRRDERRIASAPAPLSDASSDATGTSRLYRIGDVSQRDPRAARQLAAWGRDVLTSTRLLLDSPAGDDPQLHALLDDLELVLVQIIQLSGAPLSETDRALIDRALQERDLLPRIRTAVPASATESASSD